MTSKATPKRAVFHLIKSAFAEGEGVRPDYARESEVSNQLHHR